MLDFNTQLHGSTEGLVRFHSIKLTNIKSWQHLPK